MKLQRKPADNLNPINRHGIADVRRWRRQVLALVRQYGLGPGVQDPKRAMRKLRLKVYGIRHRKINVR